MKKYIEIISFNGWTPPSPVSCLPKQITPVDSETNSVGDLIITAVYPAKNAFQIEWSFLTESQVQRICSEFADFNCLVEFKDFADGKLKTGRFYPADRQPVPIPAYRNGEMLYKSFPLNIIQK